MMAVSNWNVTFINGKEYLVIDVAQFRIPLEWDPSSNMFIAVAAPTGGLGNFPALVQGDDGATPDIDSVINFEALEPDDPTPDYASWTELSPNVYQLNLGLHKGETGDPGSVTILDATDIAPTPTPIKGDLLVVNASASGFLYQAQKVGDRYLPVAINNTPSGNAAYTLAQVQIPAQRFDWRPVVEGQCVITGTGADVTVDLVVRLSGETGGNIIATGFGPSGQNLTGISTILSSCPPANSNDAYDKVLAGNGVWLYLRAERRTGAATFTTSASTTVFKVKVDPVPPL